MALGDGGAGSRPNHMRANEIVVWVWMTTVQCDRPSPSMVLMVPAMVTVLKVPAMVPPAMGWVTAGHSRSSQGRANG